MSDTRPNNAYELKATVKETWASIPPQQCHKLIISMPRRIQAVIKAKGDIHVSDLLRDSLCTALQTENYGFDQLVSQRY